MVDEVSPEEFEATKNDVVSQQLRAVEAQDNEPEYVKPISKEQYEQEEEARVNERERQLRERERYLDEREREQRARAPPRPRAPRVAPRGNGMFNSGMFGGQMNAGRGKSLTGNWAIKAPKSPTNSHRSSSLMGSWGLSTPSKQSGGFGLGTTPRKSSSYNLGLPTGGKSLISSELSFLNQQKRGTPAPSRRGNNPLDAELGFTRPKSGSSFLDKLFQKPKPRRRR